MRGTGVSQGFLVLLLSFSLTHAALGPSVVTDWVDHAQSIVRNIGMTAQVASRVCPCTRPCSMPRMTQLPIKLQWSLWQHTLCSTSGQNDRLISRQLPDISSQSLAAARKYGEAGAREVSRKRIGDGFDVWPNYKPYPPNTTSSVGHYQPEPGGPRPIHTQLGNTLPLALTCDDVSTMADPFIRAWPSYFRSAEYYSDLGQVARVGGKNGSRVRTEYDAITPWFWNNPPGTHSYGGHYINISTQVLPADMTLLQQARFFARLGAALTDAGIVAYRIKYNVQMWRPLTAIQLPDGSTGKYTPDPSWESYLATPLQPSYPSGHSTAAAAWLAVILDALGQQIGSDHVNVTIGAETPLARPYTRTYISLSSIAQEVDMSRVLAGVHFWRDCQDGSNLGLKIGQLVVRRIS